MSIPSDMDVTPAFYEHLDAATKATAPASVEDALRRLQGVRDRARPGLPWVTVRIEDLRLVLAEIETRGTP